MRRTFAIAALVAAASLAGHPTARACAPAPRRGADMIAIADEEAIIGYDPATGREDFVRRASFRTKESDFGFLVPTPTKPELAEAPDSAFRDIEEVTAPRVVTKRVTSGVALTSICAFMRPSAKSAAIAAAPASVSVLQTARVAGFDAAVLAADDAEALARWLGDHGYDNRPALAAWLAPYVAKRWIVTAFKIAAPSAEPGAAFAEPGVGTKAVRMTFTTDKPFFPYREPADQRAAMPAGQRPLARMLRVYVVTPGRVAGALANGAPWPGQVKWANTPPSSLRSNLPFATRDDAWLTTFEDASSPRPGVDDLVFAPSKDPAPVEPPPIEHIDEEPIPIPIELLGGGLAVGLYLGVRRRRGSLDRPRP